ncbi:hypothetical protein [Nonomuraea sp. NPDC049784]|uniref:hypothetical protein n=1 Tax=Nonomuraea sp. NPDC049784 TaxID=3154361 RepID=UPI0033F06264
MDTKIRRSRGELFWAVARVRNAGGTTTHQLATIARMLTGPTATADQYEHERASVFDTAGFHFDELSSEYERTTGATPYPWETATFDDLTGADQKKVIRGVVYTHAEPDEDDETVRREEPALPIALMDHMLDGLRKAAALKVEHGSTYAPAYNSVWTCLYLLLRDQSLSIVLAAEAIDHALTTGKGIAEAVAYMDGQL